MTITKTVVGNTTGYQSGDTITYQLLYRNIGTGMATGIVITDILPATGTYVSSTSSAGIGNPTQAGQTLTWPTIATLAPGAQ